jgi:hypothetical protein
VASRAVLLSTAEQRSCQLANKVARPTTALASVVLLPTAEEGARELADEIVRSAAAAAALLVATHESVHGEAAQRAVARLAVSAHAPGPVANIPRSLGAGRLVVGVRVLRGCAVVAAADGRFTRRQVPLRDAGADLDVVVLATPVFVLAAHRGASIHEARAAAG